MLQGRMLPLSSRSLRPFISHILSHHSMLAQGNFIVGSVNINQLKAGRTDVKSLSVKLGGSDESRAEKGTVTIQQLPGKYGNSLAFLGIGNS